MDGGSRAGGQHGNSTAADPKAVATMLDPFIANVVGQFRFEGPTKVAGEVQTTEERPSEVYAEDWWSTARPRSG